MKRILVNVLLACLPMVGASAYDVEIDGIYYTLISKAKQAWVTSGDIKYSGVITIPSSITYDDVIYDVTSIDNNAFESCPLTSVIIPNSVTSIGEGAFIFSGLESISIPNSITVISSSMFYNCRKLTSVTLPNSVTTIGGNAFYNCKCLTSITLPSSLMSIGSGAFECTGLTSILIPQAVNTIGSDAFESCYDLQKAEFTSVESICSIVFESQFSNPLIYSHHLYIDGNEVTELNIPNSVSAIGKYAFINGYGLTSVTIGNTVKSIGSSAFSGCKGLTEVVLGNNVVEIGDRSFCGCVSLNTIDIPNNVTTISKYSFQNCSNLETISIGTGIKAIGSAAFANCPKIENVYCYAESVPSKKYDRLGEYTDAFNESHIEYATLYVPINAIESYRSATPWSAFGTIKALDGEIPEVRKCDTPTISYKDGQLLFTCETEEVDFISEITDTDIKKHYDAEISLDATYHISVYATKTGYDNSDVAEATLCWIDGSFETGGTATNILRTNATPILIKTKDGRLTVEGLTDGSQISVYATTGTLVGTAVSSNGRAIVNTMMHAGCVAIVKTGEKSVRVIIK